MHVAELIAVLSALPPDADVIVITDEDVPETGYYAVRGARSAYQNVAGETVIVTDYVRDAVRPDGLTFEEDE